MRSALISIVLSACLILLEPSFAEGAKPLTNQDVVQMVKAGLPESTILLSIKNSPADFQTAPTDLIALKKAGISQPVLDAMLTHGAESVAPSGMPGSRGDFNPEELMLIDGGATTPMRYLTPQMRHAVRALGYGGVAGYAALRGPQASLRLKSNQPEFLLAVPENAQPESYYTLVNLAVRKNGTREIMVGGGYMSYSTGVANDRIVATVSEKLADQSAAPKNFVIYRIKTSSALPSGEYAVVLYNSQIRAVGYFASGLDSYFDFGVDG